MKIAVFTLLLFLHNSALAQEDSWTVDDSQTANPLPSDSILKWCDDSKKKVRYSQTPVEGYRLCGQIDAQKLCDPAGKRFISSDNNTAPNRSYKDCSIGERIMVKRLDPLPETESLELKPGEPMSDEERLEAHRQIESIKQSQDGDLARELQGLSKDLSEVVRGLRKGVGGKVD